jgi:hypothetical protein
VPALGNVPLQPSDAAQAVALPELQLSVDESPGATTEGLTVNVAVGTRLTVVFALAAPPGPVQDNENKVALARGPVLWLPLSASDPLHPPDPVQDAALLEVHVSIDDAPAAIAAGDAVNVTAGGERMFTVTAAGTLTPAGPEHVSEYSLAALKGPVLWLPVAARLPLQPPEAVHAVACDESQVRIDAVPAGTAIGVAVNCTVGSAFTVMATLAVWLVPPGPVQVSE